MIWRLRYGYGIFMSCYTLWLFLTVIIPKTAFTAVFVDYIKCVVFFGIANLSISATRF